MRYASLPGIFPLTIFPHNDPVEISSLHIGHRTRGAFQNARRAHIDVLAHHLANREDQVPEGDMVRNIGPADCTEVDGIVFFELVRPVGWHVPPALEVGFGGPVEIGEIELEGTCSESEL